MIAKAPVLFVIFNRIDTTMKVLQAIKAYQPEYLYIASDGPRKEKEGESEVVEDIRKKVLAEVDWKCDVHTLFRENNFGCGKGVSGAITWFFENEEMGIILEDDCLPDLSFFFYCQELLLRYKDNDTIKFIGGNNFQQGITRGEYSYYYSHYPASWGWASWRRAWSIFKADVSDARECIKNGCLDRCFNSKRERSYWLRALEMANREKEKVWDFQFYYAIWKSRGVCITPNKNLVVNLGFFDNGTHLFLKDSIRSGVKCEPIELPLVHPPVIIIDKEADEYTFDNFYSHSLRRIIRILSENSFFSLTHYFLEIFFRKR